MLFLNRLARAAAGGDDEEVERLLAAGQSPNDAGILGSPIHEASRRGRVACVKLLCNARADIKQRDAVTSETPLHCAVVFGHVQAAQILVDAGSDLNAKDLAGGASACASPPHKVLLHPCSGVCAPAGLGCKSTCRCFCKARGCWRTDAGLTRCDNSHASATSYHVALHPVCGGAAQPDRAAYEGGCRPENSR